MGKSIERIEQAASAAGLQIEIQHMPDGNRTAGDAAAACGCSVAQIVKSLLFERADNSELVLLLIAGGRQTDLEVNGRQIGSPLQRADAKRLRQVTGFAIGGVAPIGHLAPIECWMDPALLQHTTVWAAAGAPNAVFEVNPELLFQAAQARLMQV